MLMLAPGGFSLFFFQADRCAKCLNATTYVKLTEKTGVLQADRVILSGAMTDLPLSASFCNSCSWQHVWKLSLNSSTGFNSVCFLRLLCNAVEWRSYIHVTSLNCNNSRNFFLLTTFKASFQKVTHSTLDGSAAHATGCCRLNLVAPIRWRCGPTCCITQVVTR